MTHGRGNDRVPGQLRPHLRPGQTSQRRVGDGSGVGELRIGDGSGVGVRPVGAGDGAGDWDGGTGAGVRPVGDGNGVGDPDGGAGAGVDACDVAASSPDEAG